MEEKKKPKKRGYKAMTFFFEREPYDLCVAVTTRDERSTLAEFIWLLRRRKVELDLEDAVRQRRLEKGLHGSVFLDQELSEPSGQTKPKVEDRRKSSGRREE